MAYATFVTSVLEHGDNATIPNPLLEMAHPLQFDCRHPFVGIPLAHLLFVGLSLYQVMAVSNLVLR